MNNMSSIALAVCLSFGLVACGGGGGNGGGASNAQPIPQDNTPISFLTEIANYSEDEKTILKNLDAENQDAYRSAPLPRTEIVGTGSEKIGKKFIGYKSNKNAYASYAGILLSQEVGKEDVKYIIQADQPVTNAELVVNATYFGNLTYTNLDQSTTDRDVLATYSKSVTFTVKNKYISGETFVHTNEPNEKKQKELKEQIIFNNALIKTYGDNIGFKGSVKQGESTGKYEGVFVGPNAEGLVGTFDIKGKSKGAYLANKETP